MTYDPFLWVDDDGEDIDGTEFTAERMNHIEDGIAAASGVAGPQGIPGTDGDDGVGFNWRDEWDDQGEYFPSDAVQYGGSSWVCIAYTAFGVEPPGAPTEWDLVAASGAVGLQGPAGVGSGAVGGVLDGFLPNPGLASGVAADALDSFFVGLADPRLTDARVPTGAAGGILDGDYPSPGLASAIAIDALDETFAGITDPRLSDVRIPTGPAGGVLDGIYPNPGLSSAVAGSALAGFLVAASAVPARASAVLDDPFNEDKLANYVADQSTSLVGLVVDNGRLRSANALDHSLHHASLTVVNAKHMIRVIPGSGSSRVYYVSPKFLNNTNMLFMQDGAGAGQITLYSYVGGSLTNHGTIGSPAAVSGAPFWMVCRVIDNTVEISTYLINPALSKKHDIEPHSQFKVVLTGGVATALGSGVAGAPGIRLAGFSGGPTSTDWKLDEWVVVPIVADEAFRLDF